MFSNQIRIKMKKITYLFILLYLFLTLPIIAQEIDLKQRSVKLIGTWEVEDQRYLIIKENHEIALESGEEITKTAIWKLSDDGTIFYILENEEVVEEMPIVDVTEFEFKFMAGNNEMALIRKESETLDKALSEEEIAERKASIIGTWHVEGDMSEPSIDKDEPEMKVLFEEGGKLTMFKEGEQNQEAVWKLSEDGLYLIVIHFADNEEEKDEEEKAKIVSIDEEYLIILDRKTKVRFVRQ